MISRLPRWIEYGAFFLSALAGCVNAVGLLGFEHQAVSHVSGTATLLGAELVHSPNAALHLFLILLSFMAGAAISGVMIENTALKLGRHYSSALLLEGILLIAAMLVLGKHAPAGHYLASAACGLQNALITTYSGAVIRTTHITGIITDLGLMIGARLRGKHFDRRKARLLVIITAGFITGSAIGALLFKLMHYYALAIPALVAWAVAWQYYRLAHTDSAEPH